MGGIEESALTDKAGDLAGDGRCAVHGLLVWYFPRPGGFGDRKNNAVNTHIAVKKV